MLDFEGPAASAFKGETATWESVFTLVGPTSITSDNLCHLKFLGVAAVYSSNTSSYMVLAAISYDFLRMPFS